MARQVSNWQFRKACIRWLGCVLIAANVQAQQVDESFINYSSPKKYTIGGISVSGTQYLDPNAIIAITGFKVGDEITVPSDQISKALQKLWDQGILGDIQMRVSKIEGNNIYFDFLLTERPRLSKFVFFGARKSEQEDLKEKVKLIKGKIITDVTLKNAQNKVKKYYLEKGFRNVKVQIQTVKDTGSSFTSTATLRIIVNKGRKNKVEKVEFIGNSDFPDKKIVRRFKSTRNRNLGLFRARSKFIKDKYEEDKKKLTDWYNSKGYRDFQILNDTVTQLDKKHVKVKIGLLEGQKYYFRNINWEGNYLYEDKYLSNILGIKKGDVYNMSLLEKRLNYNPTGADVSSLYLDDGYLFFSVEPVETTIEKDSVDIEMRLYEGPQAIINKIIVNGNTKTNDKVILREIRTKPGEKFSRADLIRTQREIATLGFFDPEQITINPKPNPEKGTVDIEYGVVEKPSDQIELSGGWGGFVGFIGTVGISFNNFAARYLTNFRKWSPLPAGDGQKLALRVQANGPAFQSYSLSFAEPWMGGRRPNTFSVSLSHSINRLGFFGLGSGFGGGGFGGVGGGFGSTGALNRANVRDRLVNAPKIQISNITIGLGRRIRWPDDYFTLSHSISYSFYQLERYTFFPDFQNGNSNNFTFINTLSRNSMDNPTYPRRGSSMTLSLSNTPPYSMLGAYVSEFSPSSLRQYRFVEYYKVMLDASWFMNIIDKLVLNSRAHFGFIGRYNTNTPYTPFERFVLGGNGLTGFNFLLGLDVIALRGYANNSIGPSFQNSNPALRQSGGVVFNKFVYELRYPVSLNQAATVYVLAFAEGGNNFASYNEYNPLSLKKSVGVGARIFMPAFGLIGVDYGYALDRDDPTLFQPFTFSIGQQIR